MYCISPLSEPSWWTRAVSSNVLLGDAVRKARPLSDEPVQILPMEGSWYIDPRSCHVWRQVPLLPAPHGYSDSDPKEIWYRCALGMTAATDVIVIAPLRFARSATKCYDSAKDDKSKEAPWLPGLCSIVYL